MTTTTEARTQACPTPVTEAWGWASRPGRDVTLKDLTAGTVLMLVDDLRFLGPHWAHRVPGTHFIVGGITASGYMFSALNTVTGRMEHFMAERWVIDSMRVIGRVPQDAPGCDRCGCTCQDRED